MGYLQLHCYACLGYLHKICRLGYIKSPDFARPARLLRHSCVRRATKRRIPTVFLLSVYYLLSVIYLCLRCPLHITRHHTLAGAEERFVIFPLAHAAIIVLSHSPTPLVNAPMWTQRTPARPLFFRSRSFRTLASSPVGATVVG